MAFSIFYALLETVISGKNKKKHARYNQMYIDSSDYGRDCVLYNLQMAGSKEIGDNVPED